MNSQRKIFIQMSGPPGSGKSTTAKLLANSLDAVIIDHDMIKSFFLESEIWALSDDPFDRSAKLTYQFQWVLVEDLMKQGRSVIMDGVCNHNPVLANGTTLARKYGFSYHYVEIRTDSMELLDQRLQQRKPLRSQRTGVYRAPIDQSSQAVIGEGHHEALFHKWMNPKRPSMGVIAVESTSSLDSRVSYILDRIAAADYSHQAN